MSPLTIQVFQYSTDSERFSMVQKMLIDGKYIIPNRMNNSEGKSIPCKKSTGKSVNLIRTSGIKHAARRAAFILLLFLPVLPGSPEGPLYGGDTIIPPKQFIVWAHSDIQPRNEQEKEYYITALRDVRDNIVIPDIAVFGGDIVQHSRYRSMFRWFMEVRKTVPVKEWYEIAGNHEWRAIDDYRGIVRRDLHYAVRKGNILFLFMSNEGPGRRSFISDDTFRWWEEKVRTGGNNIIITVTHGNLEESGLISSNLERLTIINSERFRKVLRRHKVDLWISGHSHFPGWMPKMHYRNDDLGGTVFIDTGSIRRDFMTSVESRFLFFTPGSDTAILRYRDHLHQNYFTFSGYRIPLSHRFTNTHVPETTYPGNPAGK